MDKINIIRCKEIFGITGKDKEVIETADKYEISMISTGIRHFKH